MKFTKKFWIISAVAIVVLGIAGKWYGGRETLDEVDVEQAVIRDIVERVSASGKIQPETEVNITAEVSGQILALPVKEGDRVEKGDLLVQINPDLYEAALNRAQARPTVHGPTSHPPKPSTPKPTPSFSPLKSWQRTQQLFRDKVVSQADYDAGEANFISAEATLTAASESIRSAEFAISSAEASVQEARDNLSRTTLLAPQSGTVTALIKEVGESVQGNGFTAGEVVMKVSDLSIMEVDVEVNESDIVRVGMNDEAEVEVDAYLDETFLGTVTEIGNTALNAGLNGFAMDQVTNFSVKVRLQPESYAELLTTLEDAASPFRPGMSAKVDVLTRSADAVISVPIQSVTTRESEADEEEDELGVFVLEPSGEVRWQRVETGIQDNRYIEIKSGLDTSLTVVTGPYQSVSRTLKDGDEVEIKATEKPEAE